MRDAPYREIPLHDRTGAIVAWAKVDPEDYEQAMAFRWHNSSGYAKRCRGHSKVPLHRDVLGLAPGDGAEVDHISRDKLDCRKSNLRVVTHQRNQCNMGSRGGASRFRGVVWHKRQQVWQAQATFKGKNNFLGMYPEEEDAARAVNAFWARLGHEAPNTI
jgi:hypothetical protein